MLVSEVMTRTTVTDSPADTLRSAASRMWGQQTGSLLVMSGEELRGILTERDVMKAVARGLDVELTPVSAAMTASVITVTADTELQAAAQQMGDRWIRHLPVVEDGRVIGMLSQRDLLVAILSGRLARDQRQDRLESGANG